MPSVHALFRVVCGLLLCAACAAPVKAEETGAQARRTLEVRVEKILDVLRDPAFADKTSRPACRMRIEAEVAAIFDFNEFSSRTVGARWTGFTPEQRASFNSAFADLLKVTYLDRIDGYNGEQINYVGETVSAKGDRVEVRTTLRMKDGKLIPVSYRMLPKNGIWAVYDVIIENISLIMNYRTQFAELLLKESPEALITRIAEKARKLRENIDAY